METMFDDAQKQIVIAGPVRSKELSPDVVRLYRLVGELANRAGVPVDIPAADLRLDNLEAEHFFRVMRSRLGAADTVVAIVDRDSLSVAVEATVASMLGKRVVLLLGPGAVHSRMLAGLPGARIGAIGDEEGLLRAVFAETAREGNRVDADEGDAEAEV